MEYSQLRAAIADLYAIDDDGQLDQLVIQHSQECRQKDLQLDSESFQPGADFRAQRIARIASQLLDKPESACLAAARELFREHPRRVVALEWIDYFRGREQTAQNGPVSTPSQNGSKLPAKPRRRAW